MVNGGWNVLLGHPKSFECCLGRHCAALTMYAASRMCERAQDSSSKASGMHVSWRCAWSAFVAALRWPIAVSWIGIALSFIPHRAGLENTYLSHDFSSPSGSRIASL